MLRRVLAATLSSVVLAVLLLGVPLAVAGVVITRAEARSSVQTRAYALALEADRLVEVGAPVEAELLDRYATSDAQWPALVRVRLPGGDVLVGGAVPAGGPARDEGGPARGAVTGTATTTSGVSAEVSVPRSTVWAADLRLVVLVAGTAAGAVAAAWALAQVQARRLVRPLTDLAATAEQLGAGRVPARRAPTGVVEVDQVAGALAASAARIAAVLAAERDFSADASHQLRTPLTALSMRLEEITATTAEPATAHEAQAALAQVERLTAVIEDLLARARTAPGASPGHRTCALRPVLEQQAQEWAPVFARAGRRLDVALPAREVEVRAAPGPVAQAVATLVENALAHGAGTTRVAVRADPSAADWVVVEVGDEGAGIPDALGARVFERRVSGASGTGLGLAVARDLVVAEGGRLELTAARPPVFGVFLRRV